MSRTVSGLGRDPPGAAVVAELERVELAARERRLTAQAEADRILAAAATTVAGIEATLGARVDIALGELRARYLDGAAAEVVDIDAATAAAADRVQSGFGTPPFESAVERIVAVVLAETRG